MVSAQAVAAVVLAFAISFGICAHLDCAHQRDIQSGKAKDFGHSGSGLGLVALIGGAVLSVIFLVALRLMAR